MRCKDVRNKLTEYRLGLLNDRQRKAIEAHLEHCPRCREELAALERISELLAPAPQVTPARDLWPEIEARLRHKRSASSRLPWRWRIATAAASAAAVVALLLALWAPTPTPIVVANSDEDTMLASAEIVAQWGQPMADEAALGLWLLMEEGEVAATGNQGDVEP